MVIRNMILDPFIRYRAYFTAVKRKKYGRKKVIIRSKNGIYYLAKLSVSRDMKNVSGAGSRIRRNFVKTVNKYMKGDKCAYDKISDVYLRYVEDFIDMKNMSGKVLLVNVPTAKTDNINPISQTISRICMYADNENTELINGSDLLLRDKPEEKVDLFDRYSVDELAKTIYITKTLKAEKVILLDSACLGPNTTKACEKVLKNVGVKEVYSLCLYMGCE